MLGAITVHCNGRFTDNECECVCGKCNEKHMLMSSFCVFQASEQSRIFM